MHDGVQTGHFIFTEDMRYLKVAAIVISQDNSESEVQVASLALKRKETTNVPPPKYLKVNLEFTPRQFAFYSKPNIEMVLSMAASDGIPIAGHCQVSILPQSKQVVKSEFHKKAFDFLNGTIPRKNVSMDENTGKATVEFNIVK